MFSFPATRNPMFLFFINLPYDSGSVSSPSSEHTATDARLLTLSRHRLEAAVVSLPSCAQTSFSVRHFKQPDRGSPTSRHYLRRRRRCFTQATAYDLRTLLCPGVAPKSQLSTISFPSTKSLHLSIITSPSSWVSPTSPRILVADTKPVITTRTATDVDSKWLRHQFG